MRGSLGLIGSFVIAAGCGGGADCVVPPCAFPIAIHAKIIDKATGSPVNAHLDVSGQFTVSFDCDTACFIPGGAGQYHIQASATGYAASVTDVTVSDIRPTSTCGCEQVDQQSITISLSKTA